MLYDQQLNYSIIRDLALPASKHTCAYYLLACKTDFFTTPEIRYATAGLIHGLIFGIGDELLVNKSIYPDLIAAIQEVGTNLDDVMRTMYANADLAISAERRLAKKTDYNLCHYNEHKSKNKIVMRVNLAKTVIWRWLNDSDFRDRVCHTSHEQLEMLSSLSDNLDYFQSYLASHVIQQCGLKNDTKIYTKLFAWLPTIEERSDACYAVLPGVSHPQGIWDYSKMGLARKKMLYDRRSKKEKVVKKHSEPERHILEYYY